MRYASVCSGIEAPSAAWESLGWEPQFFSEIEPFPSAVLAHHHPDVPNHGDMTEWRKWNIGPGTTDVFIAGTPCQSFSVAGLRKGLDDPRGNLALVCLGIVERLEPKWFVWENVPGVLSSNGGRDFGAFLGALAKLGYGFAYRVLDAQNFGVPQRRRLVFVVASPGDWTRSAAVLFERESVSGNLASGRKAGKEIAGKFADRAGTGGLQVSPGTGFRMKGFGDYESDGTASTVKARDFKDATDLVSEAPITSPVAQPLDCHSNSQAVYSVRTANTSSNGCGMNTRTSYTLDQANGQAVAISENQRGELRLSDQCGALSTGGGKPGQGYQAAFAKHGVRRLTPTECERLQGFPDGHTLIPYRNKPAEKCPDGPRYKALGNSMAVPVLRWIGERIQMFEDLQP